MTGRPRVEEGGEQPGNGAGRVVLGAWLTG